MLNFSLQNFSGPLELLLHLIQKDEIAVTDIPIKELTTQFLDVVNEKADMDSSAETLGLSATLLLMKSQKLLPKDVQSFDGEEEIDPRIEMIEQLIEYCRYREAAQQLGRCEETQQGFYPRQPEMFHKELGTGIETLNIEDLQALFVDVIAQSNKRPKGTIQDEEWHVGAQIDWIRKTLQQKTNMRFTDLLSPDFPKGKLIVTFLALLELMKHQEVKVVREEETIYIRSYDPRT